MMTESPSLRPQVKGVAQIGIVVESIRASVQAYSELLGLEDWNHLEVNSGASDDSELIANGKPSHVHVLLAWTQVGQVEIELIEPRDSSSLYARFLQQHGPGVHHVLLDTEDWHKSARSMRHAGTQQLLSGRLQQSRFALFDATQTLGMVCEFADGKPLVPDSS